MVERARSEREALFRSIPHRHELLRRRNRHGARASVLVSRVRETEALVVVAQPPAHEDLREPAVQMTGQSRGHLLATGQVLVVGSPEQPALREEHEAHVRDLVGGEAFGTRQVDAAQHVGRLRQVITPGVLALPADTRACRRLGHRQRLDLGGRLDLARLSFLAQRRAYDPRTRLERRRWNHLRRLRLPAKRYIRQKFSVGFDVHARSNHLATVSRFDVSHRLPLSHACVVTQDTHTDPFSNPTIGLSNRQDYA